MVDTRAVLLFTYIFVAILLIVGSTVSVFRPAWEWLSKALNILYPIWCILGFVALAMVFTLSIIRGDLL